MVMPLTDRILLHTVNPPIFGTDFLGPIRYIYDGGSIVDSILMV